VNSLFLRPVMHSAWLADSTFDMPTQPKTKYDVCGRSRILAVCTAQLAVQSELAVLLPLQPELLKSLHMAHVAAHVKCSMCT
jgi:hypothetical protein